MSPHDGKVYAEFSDKISRQVGLLKNIVDSLEAKEKERRWAKHQTSGDLDDGKLIEGLSGEKAIYRYLYHSLIWVFTASIVENE
jgi:hypothetical protein